MGVVYLGQHQIIGHQVAVKFLHGSLKNHKEAVQRFYREAQTAAAIRHKNIIDVLDVGVTPDGEPYIVMEFLEGEGLEDMLKRRRYVTLDEACGVMEPALLALAAAHDKSVVHRDLKPDNIFLIHVKDESPEVKIIDFGISKFAETDNQTRLTQDGSLLGTPAYMSPEQARGSLNVNHLSDIYAMGIIFYEMLAGDTPFTGQQYNELLFNILTTEARPPKDINPNFPMEAWPIIRRAISKEPSERFASAAEMLEAMRTISDSNQRRSGLAQIGRTMHKDSFAGGDLGTQRNPMDNTEVAAKLLNKVNQPAHRQKLDALLATAKRLLTGPNKRFYQGGASLAGLLVVISLFFGLCSDSGDAVLITIEGAPKQAKIYYDDSLVPMNPFRVKQRETLAPIKVTALGYRQLKLSIIPSEDQTIKVTLKRKGKKAPQSTAEIQKDEPAKKTSASPSNKALKKTEPAVRKKIKSSNKSRKQPQEKNTRKKKTKRRRSFLGITAADLPWNQ